MGSRRGRALGAVPVRGGLWDRAEGGSVFGVPMGGTLTEGPFAVSGSGSIYITAFIDRNFRPDFTKEEAQAFVRRAISLAADRGRLARRAIQPLRP